MKKFILSAVAASAMAFGGFAHADLIDGVGKTLSQIFGVPYDPTPPDRPAFPVGTVYTDANGTRYQVDPAGRHIPLAQGPAPYADVVVHGRRRAGLRRRRRRRGEPVRPLSVRRSLPLTPARRRRPRQGRAADHARDPSWPTRPPGQAHRHCVIGATGAK
ncbi:hypothetical protein H0I39_20845 [Ottowia beijingensis]|uniref:Nickel/cobalt transporter regulator n=1 Tax=Ottowia beijingensis TaxID=1207057 RepID=A0A853J000_9BURK|nr:hypothetical protein [Ottowia beijingensis]NZA03492.1 hypothetical protein [Ottowia beijingensis]